MALFNYATKEITLKIVYYGPGLSGKTTNLQYLHGVLNPETKGKLLSLSTESDRTLFFDFLPIELGRIREFSIRFQLYTVPGQVRYNATRKVVLKGADAIVFVADSQKEMREQNLESFSNMRENLFSNNINPDEIPIVLQYNKRDLKNIATVDELNAILNPYTYPVTEATAVNGQGVEDTFKLVTKLLLKYISKKHKIEIQPSTQKEEPVVEAAPPDTAGTEPAIMDAIPFENEDIPQAEAAPTYAGRLDLFPESAEEQEDVAPAREPEQVSAEPEMPPLRIPVPPQESMTPPPAAGIGIEEKERQPVLEEKIDVLSGEISLLRQGMKEMLLAVQRLEEDRKSRQGNELLKDIRQSQSDMEGHIKEMAATLEGLKEKKSWFKL